MAQRVVRNVETDYLMCSICLARYRQPRLLPCGHSFCQQCLQDHIRTTVTQRGSHFFTCPNDRTQVSCPVPGLAPRDWAAAFPPDTFLTSLLNAVMIHASGSSSDLDNMACDSHKGRMNEFFCLRCAEAACAYCVVKKHKSDECECVGLDEAADKLRPRVELLRGRLEQQQARARQVHRGDTGDKSTLRATKDTAMTHLTDMETKLTFFYHTAMRQIQDMRKTIKETGVGPLSESQQATVILDNINRSIAKLDKVCNHGNGLQIATAITKVEDQAKDYDTALQALHRTTPSLQVHFTANRALERVFETAPMLGSVTVRSSDVCPPVPSRDGTPLLATPRSIASTPRLGTTPRRASDSTPARPKLSFCVQDEHGPASCWQLTGLVIVGEHLIVTDAHNGHLIKLDTRQPASRYTHLHLDTPVCVADSEDSSDVIVTLPEISQLAIVETDQDLTLKETVDTSKPYEGIGRLPGRRFVVSCCVVGQQCLDIIDVAGAVLQTVASDDSGAPLFSWPRFLAVSQPDTILVADRDRSSLLCLDLDGTKKWTYSTPASPWGVACHEGGSIFLCLDNNSVQVVSSTGQLVQTNFITARDGIRVPYAIHARGDYVAITEWGSSLFQPNSPWLHLFSI